MNDYQEILHKEIDLIQNAITGMDNRSFALKKWSLTINAALLGWILGSETGYYETGILTGVLITTTTLFWGLDTFQLHKKKSYNALYEWVIKNRPYSSEHLYSLDYKRFSKETGIANQPQILAALVPFYLLQIIGIIIAYSWMYGYY